MRVIDWKTNRPGPGEDAPAALQRLADAYRPQLEAYGRCLAGFFRGYAIRLELYSTPLGEAVTLPAGPPA